MQFQPRRHPGHIDRKATECALAIAQPWAADHASDAIRDALADVDSTLGMRALSRQVRRPRYTPTNAVPGQLDGSHLRRPGARADLQPAHGRRAIATAATDPPATRRGHAPQALDLSPKSSGRTALTRV